MKFKKIMLVSIILLAILTIGAVSAADDTVSDDMAVSEDVGGDSIAQSPTDDVNVLNGEDPDDEGPDDDYEEATIVDEFDVNDENATVVSLYCQEESGTYLVKVYNNDDYDKLISSYSYKIKESDCDTVINVTAGDLKIKEPTGYYLRVYHDESIIDEGWTSAIDYTQFRITFFDDNPGVPSTYSVLEVYCPPESIGNVTVTVRKDGEILFTSQISVEFVDGDNKLYWTLSDLNITSVGEFNITVTHGDDVLCEDESMDVVPPIEIRDDSYIGARNYRGTLVTVFLPNEIKNANITLSINGSKALTLTLDDFKHVEETTDEPFWNYPHFGPEADETQKAYTILNKHIDYGFEEGEYEITVTLNIEGMDSMELTDNVTLIERNVISNDNISIEIIKGDYEVGAEYDVIVEIFADESCTGEIVITVTGHDWNASFSLDELENDNDGWYRIVAEKFDELGEGEFEITVSYYEVDELILNVTGNVTFYYPDDDDDDADDGVVIYVPNGDDEEYNLDEDMDECFAFVSVSDELNGNITISIYLDEDEPVEILFFNKNLSEITNEDEDPENEGFTIYKIALSDLNGFDAFLEYEYFEIAFIEEGDDEPLDVRGYNIEIDEENKKIIRFWEADDDDDDEMHGEGEEIDATFKNANALNNGAIVIISKDDLPEDVDNEFLVIILDDDDKFNTTLKLNELLEGSNYIIRVNDLNMPEVDESIYVLMIVQFFTDGDESYYAEMMDEDEPILIYQSPYIFDEVSILTDDDVITFQEIPEGIDEFTVTISKEGAQDIVKTFKFSELEDMGDEDEGVFYSLNLEDLGITETGYYNIMVKFNDKLNYSGNLNVTDELDIDTDELDDEGENKTFETIDSLVMNIKLSDRIEGYIKLFADGEEIGEIDLADLPYSAHGSDNGRQVVLNNFKIANSGNHNVGVEVYDKNGKLLGSKDITLKVSVGENNVTFNNGTYGAEVGDEVIKFSISTPLLDNQCYNIYINGKKAGNFTANYGVVISDEFTDPFFDVKLFKVGDYNVNVTFFDGENETDFATGSFSISLLNATIEKTVYVVGEEIIISVKADDPNTVYYRIDASDVRMAGPVGWDDPMLCNPYHSEDIIREGMWKNGVVTFGVRLDKPGIHYVYVTYTINPRQENETKVGKIFTINVINPFDPELTINVANIVEGNDANVVITTNATFSGNVTVQIGTKNYTVQVTNGAGNTTVSGLTPKTYTATAIFAATGLFNASEKSTTFTVSPKADLIDPALTISIANITEGSPAVVLITTNANFTGNVTVQIGAKNYTVSVIKGTGNTTVAGLAAGNYNATAIFTATDVFKASVKTTAFTVTQKVVPPTPKPTIKLTLKKAKIKKSAKKAVIKATLKINGKKAVGKKLKFKFGKKTYKATTNKKGVAKVIIKKKVLKKLKVGKKVKYQVSYGGKTVKKSVKVKK